MRFRLRFPAGVSMRTLDKVVWQYSKVKQKG